MTSVIRCNENEKAKTVENKILRKKETLKLKHTSNKMYKKIDFCFGILVSYMEVKQLLIKKTG